MNTIKPINYNYISIKAVILITLLLSIPATQAMRNQWFYINWVLGGFVIFFFLIYTVTKMSIDKNLIKTWLTMSLWLIIPITVSPSSLITDLYLHFSRMLVYIFYASVCVILIYSIFKVGIKTRNSIFYYSNVIWVTVNLVMLGIFLFFNSNLGGRSDFSGIVDNRNIFAIITTFLSSYLIYYRHHYRKKKFITLLLLLSFLLVISTLSVKGAIGWLIIIVVANFKKLRIKKELKNPKTIFSILLLFALISFFIVIDNPIKERVERFTLVLIEPENLRINESAYLRMHFIKKGWEVFKDHPLTGVGINNSLYYLISPKDLANGANTGTYSHNNYIEMLLNGGLLSFLLYYIPFIYILLYLIRIKNSSILAYYLYGLSLYKVFIDFGSVTYDLMITNFIFAFIIYGYFQLKLNEKVNL